MTRAELAAEKAYPPLAVKTLYGEFDCNAYARLLFWRGYQCALDEMKKDAVEGTVTTNLANRPVIYLDQLQGYKFGDKVRIIIVKDESK